MAETENQNVIMIVVPDENDRLFAHQLTGALGYASADIIVGDVGDAVTVLRERNNSPRYLVLDIGDRAGDVLTEIDQLADYCDASTRVVVIGSVNDVQFYRELKNRGVVEYFSRPAKIADLRAALMQVSSDTAATRGQVVTFMGSASGDGASTVALNTAYALASHKQSTVVVDMDFQWGMTAKNLDLSAQYGIKELFEHPDRGIDATLIERMLVEYGPHMRLIAAPNDLRLLPNVRPETIRDLILTLQERFKYVIIDLPHLWTPWVTAALSHATHRVLVGQMWLRSATHATRVLGVWHDMGIEKHTISLVINRSGSKFKEAIEARDFERVCGKKIDHYIPNDTRAIVDAENQGKTVLETAPLSPLAKHIRDFSQTLLPPELRDQPVQAPRAGLVANLLSSLSGR